MLITPVLQGEAEAWRGSPACGGGREESGRLRPPLSASALYFAAVLPPEASLAPSSHLGDTRTHLPQGSSEGWHSPLWMALILGAHLPHHIVRGQ